MITLTEIIKQSIAEIVASYVECSGENGWQLCRELDGRFADRITVVEDDYNDFPLVVRLSLASYYLSFLVLFFQKQGPVSPADMLAAEQLDDIITFLNGMFKKDDFNYKGLSVEGQSDNSSFLNKWLTEESTFSAHQAKDNFVLDLLIRCDQRHDTKLSSRVMNDIRYIIYSLAMQDDRLSYSEKKLLDFLETESGKVKELIGDQVIINLEEYGESFDSRQAEVLLAEAKKELDTLIGLEGIKHEVKRLEAFLKIQKRREELQLAVTGLTLHFVFCGNPGTGKTTVARILGKLFRGVGFLAQGHVEETDRSGLVAEYVGQTATKTLARAKAALDGILFIDEAYALSRSTGGSSNDTFGRESIETVLKFMEDNRKRVVVVVAGYPKLMAEFINTNPGLKSRFTRYLDFEDFKPIELCQIMQLFAEKGEYCFSKDAISALAVIFDQAFKQRSDGFGNARFVRNMFEETVQNQAMRLSDEHEPPSKESLITLECIDLPKTIDDISFSLIKAAPELPWCAGCTKKREVCPSDK